jgi:hypothetical protein
MEQSSVSRLIQMVYNSKLDDWTFKFIKILTQIMNNLSKIQQNKK